MITYNELTLEGVRYVRSVTIGDCDGPHMLFIDGRPHERILGSEENPLIERYRRVAALFDFHAVRVMFLFNRVAPELGEKYLALGDLGQDLGAIEEAIGRAELTIACWGAMGQEQAPDWGHLGLKSFGNGRSLYRMKLDPPPLLVAWPDGDLTIPDALKSQRWLELERSLAGARRKRSTLDTTIEELERTLSGEMHRVMGIEE